LDDLEERGALSQQLLLCWSWSVQARGGDLGDIEEAILRCLSGFKSNMGAGPGMLFSPPLIASISALLPRGDERLEERWQR
jgi:hypothetical protein